MKILLQVPLTSYSGYGNDGIGLARAFVRWGADVYLQPTTVQAPLPPDVAFLLTKPLMAPFDLIVSHLDPASLQCKPEVKAVGDVVVGWTMWESSNFGNLKGRSKLKKNLAGFDALIGYDPVSSDCLRDYYSGPVLTVQGGFWPEDWPEVEREWNEDNFQFCMLGVLSERKAPFVAIQAFSELKNEYPEEFAPARLSLKTTMPGLHSSMEEWMPGLRVYYDTWDTATIKAFYAAHHVLLAPSRGEGKNMPALEFQSTGGTVIATNWGGHQQWLDPSYNYALDYTLVPVDADHPETLDARASVEHLKELMLHTFRNRDEVRRKGALAAQTIPKLASWDRVVERLLLQLADKVEGGKSLYLKAQSCRQEVTK